MVDQNSESPQQPGSKTSEALPTASSQIMSSPAVVQAGQYMLIFALILIFLVCCTVSVHLYLRRKKRRRRANLKTKIKTKATDIVDGPELQSQQKKFAELVGTPVCEIGESEPRHEMEDAEVPERHTAFDLQDPRDHPVVSPLDRDLEAGTMFGEMTTRTVAQPEARVYAAYWARAL